jgi:hypothetical protein
VLLMPRGNDLDRLERDLATAERRMMGAAAAAGRESLLESADAGYQERQDVHGKAYLPPKDGHQPPMERSGRLRRAYRVLASAGIGAWLLRLAEDTPYGRFLRDGTHKMEARQHIPRPDEPMPASWAARFKDKVDAAVARVWS